MNNTVTIPRSIRNRLIQAVASGMVNRSDFPELWQFQTYNVDFCTPEQLELWNSLTTKLTRMLPVVIPVPVDERKPLIRQIVRGVVDLSVSPELWPETDFSAFTDREMDNLNTVMHELFKRGEIPEKYEYLLKF